MKNSFKRMLTALLILSMISALFAGGIAAQAEDTALQFTPGTYTGISHNGRGGDVPVEVEFSEDAILSVTVGDNAETVGIGDTAIATIPGLIVENQSLAIDAVSGASLTSAAIIEAVADAVEQAGGDVDLLKARTLAAHEAEEIELSTDIIIVGAGGVGMSAAMAAADNGTVNAIVFEKSGSVGGNALISGGLVSIPGITPELEDLRVDNTADYVAYIEDIIAEGPRDEVEAEVWDTFLQQYEDWKASGSDKVFDSYEYSGILFWRLTRLRPTSRITDLEYIAKFLNWFMARTDVELEKQIGIVGMPWPNFTPLKGSVGGAGWISAMEKYIEDSDANVRIYLNTPATELLTDDTGKVIGVKAVSSNGDVYTAYASKGVILATGGFSANSDMVKEYNIMFANPEGDIPTDNKPANTGDGIFMAEAVGAVTDNMNYMIWLPVAGAYDHTTSSIVGNTSSMFMVNTDGVRFVDESIARNDLCGAIFTQPNQIAYLISDLKNSNLVDGANYYGVTEESLISRGWLLRGETIEELGAKMGLAEGVLTETVEKYNTAVQTGVDEEFGRKIFEAGSDIDMTEGPYYAFAIAPAVHITYGGIVVDSDMQVLDADGNKIEGLYAGGEVTASRSGVSNAMADGPRIVSNILGTEY